MSLEDKPLSLRGGVGEGWKNGDWGGLEERGLEIGDWRLGSGEWGVESGDWRVESGDGRSLMSYLDIAEKNSSIPPHPRPPLLEDEGVFTPINIVVKRKVIR